MSMLVRFNPSSLTAEKYDATVSKLTEQGDFPPEGLDLHVCFGTEGELKVSEVWDSQETFDAFGERLVPVLEEAGIDPGEPQIIEIHNIIRR